MEKYVMTYYCNNRNGSSSTFTDWTWSNKKEAVSFISGLVLADDKLIEQATREDFLSDIILKGDVAQIIDRTTGSVIAEKTF